MGQKALEFVSNEFVSGMENRTFARRHTLSVCLFVLWRGGTRL